MPLMRNATEFLARKTTRRGFFSRSGDIAFGALIGAAAGTMTRAGDAVAQANTYCSFPGPACPCDGCLSNGMCAKPCIIMTFYYAGGCWVTLNEKLGQNVTCCDCDCNGLLNFPGGQPAQVCGCGSDYHNNPELCP